MLTPNETHFVAGILSMIASPDGVTVELGSRLHDRSADTERDVDVVISFEAGGNHFAVIGLEVKAHTRPLTIEHIEQLALKLHDLPALGQRAIVSASGYTATAIRKAKAHQIELFTLSAWRDSFRHLGLPIQGSHSIPFRETYWVEGPHVELVPAESHSSSGKPISELEVEDPVGVVLRRSAQSIIPQLSAAAMEQHRTDLLTTKSLDQTASVQCQFPFTNYVGLVVDDRTVRIGSACINGKIAIRETDLAKSLRYLVKEDDGNPVAGCAIADLASGELHVLAFDVQTRRIELHRISVEDRGLVKIFRRCFTSAESRQPFWAKFQDRGEDIRF